MHSFAGSLLKGRAGSLQEFVRGNNSMKTQNPSQRLRAEGKSASGKRGVPTSRLGTRAVVFLFASGMAGTAAFSQAERSDVAAGAKTYVTVCAPCHGGSDSHATNLSGEQFLSEWSGKSARALYARILSTMPQTDPGSLDTHTVLEVTAYLLSRNRQTLPEGTLTTAKQLDAIIIQK